jgi:hypothetical protein
MIVETLLIYLQFCFQYPRHPVRDFVHCGAAQFVRAACTTRQQGELV